MSTFLPEHLKPAREFKTRKRRELRAVLRAIDTLRYDIAYVPDDALSAFAVMDATANALRARLRAWGR